MLQLKCHQCGEAFDVYPSRAHAKYCSNSCYALSKRGKDRPEVRAFPGENVCENCGIVFLVGGTNRPRRTQRYCSDYCSRDAQALYPEARQMSELECAWLAGVIDGEGSIVFPKGRPSRNIRLSVYNTYKPFIDHLVKVTDTGRVLNKEKYKTQAHHATSYAWQLHGKAARSVLAQVLPWLIIKRERALVALEMAEA